MKIVLTCSMLLSFCFSAYAGDSYIFTPDTEAIRNSWPEFFKDQVYLSLSTTTRHEVSQKLFKDLIAGDTTYQSWDYGLRQEAKKIFFTKAGFSSEVQSEKMSAEDILKYDNENGSGKTQKLGTAIVRSNEAKLPSLSSDIDKNIPKTEIPHPDVKKLTMPVGRSWFSSPLEDLQNDPNFIGYIAIMRSKRGY